MLQMVPEMVTEVKAADEEKPPPEMVSSVPPAVDPEDGLKEEI